MCSSDLPSQTKRIDGVIAAVMALSQLVLLPPKRRVRSGMKLYVPGQDRFVPVTPEPAHA